LYLWLLTGLILLLRLVPHKQLRNQLRKPQTFNPKRPYRQTNQKHRAQALREVATNLGKGNG
jgi:hypothetical protein